MPRTSTPSAHAHAPPPLQAWQVILGGVCSLVLTLGLARFAFTPLLPLMHEQAGLSDAAGGALAAINYAGYMSGALLASWLESARLRHGLYSVGLVLSLLVTMLMGLSDNFWVWALSRYFGGLCGAAGMLLGSGLVLNWLMRAGHRPELGLHFTGIGLGIVVSALGALLMGGQGLHLGWAPQWMGFALIGLVFLAFAWRWRPPVPPVLPAAMNASASGNAKPQQVQQALPAKPARTWTVLMTAVYFCAGWGFVISATFTVTIVERQPLLAGQGPWAWLLVGLAATPAVFLWDRVARRVGELQALLMAFVLQCVSVLVPALSDTLAAALTGALLYGATFIGIVSMTLALVGRRSPANPGKAMARLTLSYGVAQVCAPALSGAMAQASGSYRAALLLTAVVLALGMVGLLALIRWEARRKSHD